MSPSRTTQFAPFLLRNQQLFPPGVGHGTRVVIAAKAPAFDATVHEALQMLVSFRTLINQLIMMAPSAEVEGGKALMGDTRRTTESVVDGSGIIERIKQSSSIRHAFLRGFRFGRINAVRYVEQNNLNIWTTDAKERAH
ncbi:hypothetical protein V493_00801 [Pseudogymnoascus sp. VKM F-4281 (FW-2241)]|nr:hypothetical protein V493_00801 [Pseudogymnoascus sp. VKM F-4281 (FW-2241)]